MHIRSRTGSVIPLLAALASCYQGPNNEAAPPLAVTGTDEDSPEGARMPLGTSLLLEVVDPQGNPIPRARVVLPLPPPPDGAIPTLAPDNPAHLMNPVAHSSAGIEYRTDAAGRLLMEELERYVGDRLVARVEASGYAPASSVLEGVQQNAHMAARVVLVPVAVRQAFDTSQGVLVVHEGLRVEIPADGVVDENGEHIDGLVEISVVPFDSSRRALEQPGPLQATRIDGAAASLRSLGMAEVSLSRDSLPLKLAPGAKARLELPLPATLSPMPEIGDQIEAWWYDLDAGLWREEGVGVVVPATDRPGELAWTTEVAHFTWWNVDEPWTDHSCLLVTVHEDGVPKQGITVQVIGLWGESQPQVTDANGEACTAMKRGEIGTLYVGPKNAPITTVEVQGSQDAAACDGNGAACKGVAIDIGPNDMECEPGASYPCQYTGPEGTENVGICQTGTNFCDGQGKWTGCSPSVVPAPAEDPNTPEDDNCNGLTDEGDASCPGLNVVAACYDGPAGTLGIGECVAGQKKCIDDGKNNLVWGGCIAAIPPDIEICDSPFDEDCDGNPGCGLSTWGLSGGDVFAQRLSAVAVGSNGDVFVLGRGAGTMTLGNKMLNLGAIEQAVLAHVLPDGTVFGLVSLGQNLQGELEIAVRGDQQLFVTGKLAGVFAVPGCNAAPGDASDGLLVEFDGLVCKATRVIGGLGETLPSAVAVGGDRVYVAGGFGGTLGSLMTNDNQDDAFVLGFDALDITKPALVQEQFAATWPSYLVNRPALAATPNGFAMVFGYAGIVTLAGKNFAPPEQLGSTLIARFDKDGLAQWAADLGGFTSAPTSGYALALDAQGAITVAADHGDGLTVSQWSDPDGAHWKHVLLDSRMPLPEHGGARLATAAGGRVVLNTSKVVNGVDHAYMHKWTTNGDTDWSHDAGDPDPNGFGMIQGLGVAVSPVDQATYVTGRMTSNVAFPDAVLLEIVELLDQADGYLVKLQP